MRIDSPEIYNCEFAEEIVDFLYGEISGDRKNAFDLHLRACSDCSQEIADFSGLRFSIQDWKTDFDKLETPEISIPYKAPAVRNTVVDDKPSVFDGLRNFFRLSPMYSGAAVAAVLAVVIGLGIFMSSKNNSNELLAAKDENSAFAGNNTQTANKSPQKQIDTFEPLTEKQTVNEPPAIVAADDAIIGEKQTTPLKIGNSKQKSVIQPVRANVAVNDSSKSTANQTNRDLKPARVKNKPKLDELPDENEDESLRLADLFAELDTRE